MSADAEREVRAAAEALVAAFGSHDTAAYFAAFAPEASFVFHSTPDVLADRAAYEDLWAQWESEGFRVLGCTSRDLRVQPLGADAAIVTHRVATRVVLDGVEEQLDERESIVFARVDDGRWLAVHEHLSPLTD